MSKRNQTGEWIKLGRDLWTHPKVRRIADILGGRWQPELPLAEAFTTGQIRTTVLVHAVVSGLSRLFLTVNRHASEAGDATMDAVLTDMTTDDYLDEVSGLPGMQAAMIAVGWAVHDKTKGVIRLPNYLEHNALNKGEKRAGARGNSESAEAKRKREERARKKEASARTTPGQLPDNSPGQSPDEGQISADNLVEKSIAEAKTHIGKKVLSVGQDELKARIDALRPESWGKAPVWMPADEAVLEIVKETLAAFADDEWLLLAWFFRWCSDAWNQQHRAEETRVTGSRKKFLEGLADYLARARRLWLGEGRPRLTPKVKAPAATASGPLGDASADSPRLSLKEQLAALDAAGDSSLDNKL